jgi:GNAT superfamily N-acetyltransferase
MTSAVSTRPVAHLDDRAFLLAVYDATRRSEFSTLGWSDPQLDAFMAMQFEAQGRHYAVAFPDAAHLVVLVGGEPAGRIIVDRTDAEIRIIDVALLPHHRRVGVGGALVRQLCEEADTGHLPLRCQVALDNDARSFWAHLGFEERGIDGLHVALERPYRARPG